MCVRSREQRKREKRTANSEFAKSISEASRQMREFILWIIESCLVVALGTIQPVRVREREREPHFVHCIWIDMAVEMKQNVSDWKWHGMHAMFRKYLTYSSGLKCDHALSLSRSQCKMCWKPCSPIFACIVTIYFGFLLFGNAVNKWFQV